MKAARVDTWATELLDIPGGLAEKLTALAEANVNLEMVISRRVLEKPGTGVLFVTPIVGAGQIKAAKKANFHRTPSMHTIRVEGADKPGLGAKISSAIAAADISLRGFTAATMGRKFVAHISVITEGDAKKVLAILRRL